MKKILLSLLLFPVVCIAQTRLATPVGGIISISPGTTITQTSPSTVFFTEVIPANTFVPNRWYHLKMAFKLTTPLLGVPGISCTFQYGSQTFNLMSGSALVGSTTNGLFQIDFYMISSGLSSQIPFAIISQPNGSLITLSPSTSTPVGAFTIDSTIDQTLSCSLVFTGISLGTSSLNNFWTYREAY